MWTSATVTETEACSSCASNDARRTAMCSHPVTASERRARMEGEGRRAVQEKDRACIKSAIKQRTFPALIFHHSHRVPRARAVGHPNAPRRHVRAGLAADKHDERTHTRTRRCLPRALGPGSATVLPEARGQAPTTNSPHGSAPARRGEWGEHSCRGIENRTGTGSACCAGCGAALGDSKE